MPARADIELVAMPGAGDVGLVLRERKAQARLVWRYQLLHAGDDLPLADRSSHMGANVLESRELAVAAEHSDRDAVDLDDLAAGVGEPATLPIATRCMLLPSPSPPLCLRPRRYHIAKSNRLMSAARNNSLTTRTISVGVTLSAVTGAGNCSSASAFAAYSLIAAVSTCSRSLLRARRVAICDHSLRHLDEGSATRSNSTAMLAVSADDAAASSIS